MRHHIHTRLLVMLVGTLLAALTVAGLALILSAWKTGIVE